MKESDAPQKMKYVIINYLRAKDGYMGKTYMG